MARVDGSGGVESDNTGGNDVNANKVAAQAFGLTEALLKLYPELTKVWDFFLAGNITDAKLAYFETGYYENLTDIFKNRSILKTTQKGVYDQELSAYRISQKKRLIDKGINLDDASFNTITEDSFDKGLDDNQLDLTALKAFTGKLGGSTLGTTDSLKDYANQFGMSYSDKDFDSWGRDLVSGATTVEDLRARFRQDSASTYPAYADSINKGVSLGAQTSAFKTSMGNILELDPDAISYNDQTLRRALQYVGPDGKAAVKPLWQFESELRSDVRWQFTDNGRDAVDSMQYKVMKDWGLM